MDLATSVADRATLERSFLTPEERGNPYTAVDSRHPHNAAWTTGDLLRPPVHGATYFSDFSPGSRGCGTVTS